MGNAKAGLGAEFEDSARGKSFVGTSGWAYREWRGKFYPKGLRQADELSYTAERLATIEMNSPFYRLQSAGMYEKWSAQAPDDFCFAVKGWRGVTHFKKLRDAADAVTQFFGSGILNLGKQLGPVLWQLPPSLKFDGEVLDEFLGSLPQTLGAAAAIAEQEIPTELAGQRLIYAVEPRNESFNSSEAIEVLQRHNAALVMADSAGRHPEFQAVTADFVYVRLHGSPRIYYSNYSEEALTRWAEKLRPLLGSGHDCYVYFDNTALSYAPYNAMALEALLQGDSHAPVD